MQIAQAAQRTHPNHSTLTSLDIELSTSFMMTSELAYPPLPRDHVQY